MLDAIDIEIYGLTSVSRIGQLLKRAGAIEGWNDLISYGMWYGAYISVVGIVCFVVVVTITSARAPTRFSSPTVEVEQTPTTPEWLLPSPLSFHTFSELPALQSYFHSSLLLC